MSDSANEVWAVFISGLLATVILVVGVVVAVVVSQRRYMKLHRNHARRVLEAQEEERAWVSREVHDDAVQRLALIGKECARVSQALAGLSEAEAKRIGAIQTEVQDLGVFLRGLAHRLHPALIDRGGLLAALSGLAEEMNRSFGIEVQPRLPAPEALARVSPQRALVVYRIAQEALHNVAKHAAVTQAELELSASNGTLELTITDQGKGFDVKQRASGDGIGLIGIQERAYLAEGAVEISSRRGQGTVVRATFPIDQDSTG